jgi:UDP-N-acetylglucosamine transferase subunit ALG13
VIFVTVGTHHQPFTRLIEALDALPAGELVVQHGHSPAPRHAAEATPFLGYAEMVERMHAADAIVTHAGVGSVLTALRLGRTPAVVPRRRSFAEHVDDHQVQLTAALAGSERVVPVWDMEELAAVVASLPPPRAAADAVAGPLHAAVRRALVPGQMS